MKCHYSCNSPEHTIARRDFLGGMIGGVGVLAGGVPALATPAVTQKLASDQKRVLVVFMSGGLSQLESWDPKPKTETGGPFRSIPTAVPGIHISELLPQTARHMDKLALIRGINTRNGDHGKGRYQMTRGRDQRPGDNEPHLGAVIAKSLEDRGNPLPGHIKVPSPLNGDGAYLGPRYASVGANGKPPANSARPSSLTENADQQRNTFRKKMNDHFANRRRTAETDLYTYSYEQAQDLMRRRDVFDLSKEPAKEHDRYGKSDFGQHCLLARRLLEHGVTYAQVSHANYDTHNENFSFHLEQLGEFDQSFSVLIQDLHDRGMLDSTLVVVMSEFGRTPKINARYGRDHWGNAWSVCLGGAGIQAGALVGKTNEAGTAVTDREVDHGNLFHTYLSAVGLDSTDTLNIGGRQFPLADPSKDPISELLV
jgi:hypothetical protein